MKILLHGATNNGSTNYGDFIYGQQVYDYLTRLGHEVAFYQPSKFFVDYACNGHENPININKADLFIYLPGGYFGEGPNNRFRSKIKHFFRFMLPGLNAIFHKIPVIVIGIGAGPISSPLFYLPIKYIGKRTIAITTRDHESYNSLVKLDLKNVVESTDMILSMDIKRKQLSEPNVRNIFGNTRGKKILLAHYNHSKSALNIFADSLKIFLDNHPEYMVLVTSDSILPYEDSYYKLFATKLQNQSLHYIYKNPYELSEILSVVDVVLTCKLHVGVVAAMFGKSVLCIAEHYSKSIRFYRQIDEKNRCVSLYECTVQDVVRLLEQYHQKPITIPRNIIDRSKIHWSTIDGAISSLSLHDSDAF